MVFHFEGGLTALVIRRFYVNLVHTGAVPSHPRLLKCHKRSVKGVKYIDITVGDNFVHLATRLGALHSAKIVAIALLVN